ncbi:MAG: penicillin-binding protein activator [Rhodospirillaceae bacterium]|nr:penicillin-binding protein activator [Rhodospirillaceae bacterium]
MTVAYAGLPIKTPAMTGAAAARAAGAAFAALRRPVALLVVALALALALAACAPKGKPGSAAKPPERVADQAGEIRVALLLPLSGRYAAVGASMENAAHMAVMESGNRDLTVLSFDTGGTAKGAAAAARKAIAARARLIVGPLFREAVAAVRRPAARARINVLAFSNSESVAGGNVFLLSFLLRQQVDRIVRYAAVNGFAEIGVLAPASATGERIVMYAEAAAQRHGAEIRRTAFYSGRIADMRKHVETFAEEPDYRAVLIHAGGDDLRSLAGLLAFNDVLPPDYRFLGTSRWNDPSVRAERHLRGGWFAAPAPDISARFAERYEQVFKAKPDRFSSMAYDAIALAAALAKQAQPKRNPFTRRALTDPNGFLGTDGIFRFRENGLIERGLAVLEVRRSRFETIDPPPDSFAIGTN